MSSPGRGLSSSSFVAPKMAEDATVTAWNRARSSQRDEHVPGKTKEFPRLDHFGSERTAPREVAKAITDYFLKERRRLLEGREVEGTLSGNSSCVRTVSHTPRNPGQTSWFTGTCRCTSLLREVVDGRCVDGFSSASLCAERINFQACSFNHSDISPSLKSTTCERSEIRLSYALAEFVPLGHHL